MVCRTHSFGLADYASCALRSEVGRKESLPGEEEKVWGLIELKGEYLGVLRSRRSLQCLSSLQTAITS